jgi:hypothetical protein
VSRPGREGDGIGVGRSQGGNHASRLAHEVHEREINVAVRPRDADEKLVACGGDHVDPRLAAAGGAGDDQLQARVV